MRYIIYTAHLLLHGHFVTMPTPSIQLCAFASHYLLHSHKQVVISYWLDKGEQEYSCKVVKCIVGGVSNKKLFSTVWTPKTLKKTTVSFFLILLSDTNILALIYAELAMMNVNNFVSLCSILLLGTIHKHLLGGLMQKGGPLKSLILIRGALKNITNFPVKIEFTAYGWPVVFMAKRGAWYFLRSEGGPWKIFAIFFCIRPHPYKCLWTVPYPAWKITLYLSVLIMFHFPYLHFFLCGFTWLNDDKIE